MIFDKSQSLRILALCDAAYSFCRAEPFVLPAGFTLLGPIVLHKPVNILHGDTLTIWGMILIDERGITHYVFRGTQGKFLIGPEWMADLMPLPMAVFQRTEHGIARVHGAFYAIYCGLQLDLGVIDTSKVQFHGHSLGAAIAGLCMAEYGCSGYLFECPRIGNSAFASMEHGIHIENDGDAVCHVPLPPLFQHGGAQRVTVHGPRWGDFKQLHSLESVRNGIGKLMEVA